jgi:hypothetical protein
MLPKLRRPQAGGGARRDFREEINSKRVASKPRPAQLPSPDLRCGPPPERLRERLVNDTHAQTSLSNELGGRRVFRRFESERANAANRFEQVPAKQHRLALRKAHSDAVAKTLPARLVGVEERAFQFGPHVAGSASNRGR